MRINRAGGAAATGAVMATEPALGRSREPRRHGDRVRLGRVESAPLPVLNDSFAKARRKIAISVPNRRVKQFPERPGLQ